MPKDAGGDSKTQRGASFSSLLPAFRQVYRPCRCRVHGVGGGAGALPGAGYPARHALYPRTNSRGSGLTCRLQPGGRHDARFQAPVLRRGGGAWARRVAERGGEPGLWRGGVSPAGVWAGATRRWPRSEVGSSLKQIQRPRPGWSMCARPAAYAAQPARIRFVLDYGCAGVMVAQERP